jgi:hypothetical protein
MGTSGSQARHKLNASCMRGVTPFSHRAGFVYGNVGPLRSIVGDPQ